MASGASGHSTAASVALVDLKHHSERQQRQCQTSRAVGPDETPSSSSSVMSTSATTTAPLRSDAVSVISLPEPGTGEDRDYLLVASSATGGGSNNDGITNSGGGDIYEVQSLTGPSKYGSFFVGSRVVPDGALRVATRVDPLFFVLAAIDGADKMYTTVSTADGDEAATQGPKQGKWQPLDQILARLPPHVRTALRNASSSSSMNGEQQLYHAMFHRTDQFGDDLILYKFDETRVLTWLTTKQRRAAEAVKLQMLRSKGRDWEVKARKERDGGGGSGAFSSTFNVGDDDVKDDGVGKAMDGNPSPAAVVTQSPSSSQGEGRSRDTTTSPPPKDAGGVVVMLSKDEEAKAGAAGLQLVCEYLSERWRTKLIESLGMTADDLVGASANKRSKRRKANDDHYAISAATDEEDGFRPERQRWEAGLGGDGADELLRYTMGADGGGGGAGGVALVGMDDEEREKVEKKRKAMNAQSVGLKRLAKVKTKGMKSIASFFGGGGGGGMKKKAKKA